MARNRKTRAEDLRPGDVVEGWSGPVRVAKTHWVGDLVQIEGVRKSDGKKLTRRCSPDQMHEVAG